MSVRVLLADDNPNDRALALRELRRDLGAVEFIEVLDAEDLASALEGDAPGLVVTDYELRWTNGLEVLRAVKERWPDCAVVMFTGTGSEEIAVEAMKDGLDDYVVKTPEHFRRLADVARSALDRSTGRRIAADLRDSEARLDLVLGQVPAVVWTTDTELRFTSSVGAGLAALGLEPGEVVGMSLPEYFATDDPAFEPVAVHRRALAGETGSYGTEWQARVYEAHVQPLREADGTISGTVGIAIDVTERKRLEAELLQSQKIDTVGRLAGGIAHDFNNLLTAIGGYLDLLLAQLPPDDPRRDDAEEARLATQRAAELTQGLLAFARKSESSPRLVDVNEIVTGIVPMLRRLLGEHIAVEPSLDGGPTVVRADPGGLEQVLVNFAVNAESAMPGGGTFSITTASTPESVVLTVRDTGHGMDAETKARLFEPFFTTKEQGTGLGLATVYGIVAQVGGTIDVESEPGHGTAFAVTLPRVSGAQATAEVAVALPEAPRGSATVLFAEDNDQVRSLVERTLTMHGFTVLAAANAEQAIKLSVEHDGPIQLLVTDVSMPGLSGPQLAERIRSERPEIGVLYMSGYADEIFARFGVAPDAGRLDKPFTADALLAAVAEALGS